MASKFYPLIGNVNNLGHWYGLHCDETFPLTDEVIAFDYINPIIILYSIDKDCTCVLYTCNRL